MVVDIIDRIAEKTGKSKEEVLLMVENKRKELDYLISEEGAAHIIASELGVSSQEYSYYRVMRTFPVREFERNGNKGKVKNIIVSDGSESIRISLWDSLAETQVEEGDVIRVAGGQFKETKWGKELRLGKGALIERNPESFPDKLKNVKPPEYVKKLSEAEEGKVFKSNASIIRVFEREPFYEKNGSRELIVSCIIDDGTDSIRAVFFGNAVEKLMGMSKEDILNLYDGSGSAEVLEKVPVLVELKITGRIKKGMTGNLEMIVNNVEVVNPGEEVDRLINEIIQP